IRTVSVRLQGGAGTPSGLTALTDDDGRFEFTGVPAGTHELYVSVVDFMLVKRTVILPAGGTLDLTIPVAPGTGTYTESVTVRAPGDAIAAPVAEQTLSSGQLQQLHGLI